MADTEYTDEERLAAARRHAQWYLGYPDWADRILGAYNNPELSDAQIRIEKEEFDG